MTDAGERPDEKRMRLRYAGHCRVCGAALPAGTDAVYERATRTVRCLECAPPLVAPAAESSAILPAPARPVVSPTPAGRPDTPVVSAGEPPVVSAGAPPVMQWPRDALRLRAPASAVISETLRVQALAPVLSRTARLLGRDPLSPDARSWFVGALGELEVARELDRLGPGWHVVHAIPIGERGSDIDHLVIGPAGVFTVNTKRHPGRVWVGGRVLMVNGQRTNHVRNAEHEARRVERILGVPVHGIIALVAVRRLTIKQRPEAVSVVTSKALVRWLNGRPRTLPATEVTRLTSLATDPRTWSVTHIVEPDLLAFAALRESRESAGRRRAGWGCLSFLVIGGGALLTLPILSAILTDILLSFAR